MIELRIPVGATAGGRQVEEIIVGGAPEIPGELGEQVYGHGRSHVAFTTTGSVSLRVDPGEYEVVVSRGFEYGLVLDFAEAYVLGREQARREVDVWLEFCGM